MLVVERWRQYHNSNRQRCSNQFCHRYPNHRTLGSDQAN